MKRALTIAASILWGCSSPGDGGGGPAAPPPNPSSPSPTATSSGTAQPPDSPPGESPNPLGRYRCRAPAGMGSPGTIEQAVALLNALPKPTSVACFVESLDRPLAAFATNSSFSAQPALSTASPRVFIKIAQLWLSIVIDGESSELVEFGYLIPNTMRSIKAELHFPLPVPVDAEAPYRRVLYDDGRGTMCRFCHSDELPESVPGIDNVFSSIAFQPRPDTYVSIASLRAAAESCDWQVEPHRCEMLAAVFGDGPVVEEPFPADMPRFF